MEDFIDLKDRDFFHFLRSDQVDKLSAASKVITRKPGEKIYRKGDKAIYFYIVLKGKVSLLFPINSEDSVSVDKIGKGSVFGLSAGLNMTSYYVTAECLEESEILTIEYETLRKLMEGDLLLGYSLQKIISEIYFKRYINLVKNLKAIV